MNQTIRRISLFLFLATQSPASAQTSEWSGGAGSWSDASHWKNGNPARHGTAAISGTSAVVSHSDDIGVARLEVGPREHSNVHLTLEKGTLRATDFIRIGEYADSHGNVLIDGARVCTPQIGLGGLNEGEPGVQACSGTLEIRSGSLLTRHLSMGWRQASQATFRVVGSKAESISVLDLIHCALPTGKEGSHCVFEFQLDSGGVTPVVLWNKRESIRLARGGAPALGKLSVALLEPPPGGDIALLRSFKPCTGEFQGLPEGSSISARHDGIEYAWTLSYRGGKSQCDIILKDPKTIAPNGSRVPFVSNQRQRIAEFNPEAISAEWDALARVAESENPAARETTLAFPGAEGFGAYSKGGRAGKVCLVTNLEDSGPGSLREAIETKGPRTVVFRVGGTIELKTPLQIREPYLTIAGQTAPGDGICLKGSHDTLTLLNTHNVVIRFLRVRTGFTGNEERHKGDCISAYSSRNFIIDHCSTSWGTDETLSCTETCDLYTIQWCMITEGLNFYGHSMASIIGGDRSTWHHNIFAHCRTRNPRFANLARCDYRNNVIYNWGDTSGYGDFRALDYVNNFLKPGPSTTQRPPQFLKPDGFTLPDSIHLYGNTMDGAPGISKNNPLGADFDPVTFSKTPHPFPHPATQTAEEAYACVLDTAGSTLPKRDSVDARIVREVRERSGKIISYESEAGPFPIYRGALPPEDADGDGIPDHWELQHGLDPKNPLDGSATTKDGYTNLEQYLNSLVQ